MPEIPNIADNFIYQLACIGIVAEAEQQMKRLKNRHSKREQIFAITLTKL